MINLTERQNGNKEIQELLKLHSAIEAHLKNYPIDVAGLRDKSETLRELTLRGVETRKASKRFEEFDLLGGMSIVRSDSSLVDMAKLHMGMLKRNALYNFDSYLQYVEYNRDPAKKFYSPRRSKLRLVVDGYQMVVDDEIDILTVSLPPRIGKTTLGIFFLSWILGRFPRSTNIGSGYSDTLTGSFHKGLFDIIKSPEYLWSELFNLPIISTNRKEQLLNLNDQNSRYSTFTGRSIHGSLTGVTDCDGILYSDDLISGLEEAMNPDRLSKLWEIYNSDLRSRKKESAKEILVGTRWSINDVIGHIEAESESGYTDLRYKSIVLPALNVDGESNFDFDYGVGFSTTYYKNKKAIEDEVIFSSLYQSEPYEREGALYKADELMRYMELPERYPDKVISVCDTKNRGSDYSVMPICYVYGDDMYIEDIICDNGLPEHIEPKLAKACVDHKVVEATFESNSAGGRIADDVEKLIQKQGVGTIVKQKWTQTNKDTRIILSSSWVKSHCYFKDRSLYDGVGENSNPDYRKAMQFLFSYVTNGKNKNDDVPDAFSLLHSVFYVNKPATITAVSRPF